MVYSFSVLPFFFHTCLFQAQLEKFTTRLLLIEIYDQLPQVGFQQHLTKLCISSQHTHSNSFQTLPSSDPESLNSSSPWPQQIILFPAWPRIEQWANTLTNLQAYLHLHPYVFPPVRIKKDQPLHLLHGSSLFTFVKDLSSSSSLLLRSTLSILVFGT